MTGGEDPASSLTAVAFVEALPGHVAQRVRVLCGQHASKEDVVDATKDIWDETDSEVTAVASRLTKRSPVAILQQRYSSQTNSSKLEKPLNADLRRCYGCGVIGHLRRACSAVCTKCGGKRHTEQFCRSSGNEPGEQ